MKKLFKPSSLLLSLLALLVFFILGLLYAGWIEAGKNQGLAAGAIVLGYGVISAFFGLILSFFAIYYLSHRAVVKTNIVLSILLLGGVLLIVYNANQRKKQRETDTKPTEQLKPTSPVDQGKLLALAKLPTKHQKSNYASMGLGFFKPNFFNSSVLHFYGKPNLEKSLNEHAPIDKLLFSQDELGNYVIAEAPPWFSPIHLKLEYGILFFKVISISEEFVEVIGNEHNGYSTFLSRTDGELIFWPDFLLTVSSIELLQDTIQPIRIKPLENASTITTTFSFMKVLSVKDEWVQVKLFDDDFMEKGLGWVRWKKEGQLLISYSLLS